MKKIYSLALTFGLLYGANAQNLENVKFGIKGGMNLSKMTNFTSKVGYHAGVKAELNLPQISEGVFIEGAVLVSSKGAKLDYWGFGKSKVEAAYLEIPIQLGYKHSINSDMKLMGSFGPYFAYGLFGKQTIDYDWDGETDREKYDTFGDEGLKRFVFGLGLSAGIEFKQKYQFSIGYDFGLMNIYNTSTDDEDTDITGSLKNSNLKISVAYLF